MSLAFVSWAAAHELEVPFDPPGDSCAVRSAVDDCNLIHLAAMDNSRGLLHKQQINCTHWTSWLELGGKFAGGPALVKNSRGQIELYVRGVDKHMYRRVYSHACAVGSPGSDARAGERLRSVGEKPETVSFSNEPSTHPQPLEGAARSGKQRVYVQMIEQPPSSAAAAPSIGRAVTLSIDSADSMAALSKRIAEALGAASGSEVGLPRIYLANAELTDAEHLERSAAQNSIPPESTLHVLPTMGSEAEALRLRVLAVSEKFMPAEMAGQQAGQPSSRLLYAAADPTDSGWAPPRWQCLGGCFTSSPAAIVDTAGLVHLFARGCDRALWRLSQQAHPVSMQPVSRAPAPHPSNLPSLEDGQPARERLLYAAGDPAAKAGASPTPAAAGWAAEGAAEDGEDEWQSNDARWGEWASMGGIITSAPAASVDAEGMLHVFCRGITRALTHLRQRWNGTAVAWEAWESLGGALASGPQQRGLSDGSNFINLYVRGSDRAVWRKIEQANVTADPAGRRLGVRWSNWESLGGAMSSGVSVASTPDGLSEVFARGPDRGLWHKRQSFRAGSADPSWSKWTSLSGTLSSAAEVVQVPTLQGELHVFSRGLDGGVWHKAQVGGAQPNGSVEWNQWRSLGGATRLFNC